MAYVLLTSDEQDETLTAFLLAQERDQFSHTVNRDRYDALLVSLPKGPFFDRIQKLRDETASRLDEVNAVIAHTVPQLPSQARLDAALGRLKLRGAV